MKAEHSGARGMLPQQYSVCVCAVGINKHRRGEREEGLVLGVCVCIRVSSCPARVYI